MDSGFGILVDVAAALIVVERVDRWATRVARGYDKWKRERARFRKLRPWLEAQESLADFEEVGGLWQADSTTAPHPIPLPESVLTFCDDESEDFAREACYSRARDIYRQTSDWKVALSALELGER